MGCFVYRLRILILILTQSSVLVDESHVNKKMSIPSLLSIPESMLLSTLTRKRAYTVSPLPSCSFGVCGVRTSSLLDDISIVRVRSKQFVNGNLICLGWPGNASIEYSF